MKKFLTLILLAFFSCINFAQHMELINEKSLQNIIDNRDGKVLVINVWATWCIPCREEMPDLSKIYSNYNEHIDLIAISVDYPDEWETKILPFIQSSNLNFPIYVNNFETEVEIISFLNNEWNGALPGTFIYDENGKQVKFMEGKHSYENFSSELTKLFARD